MRVFRVRLNDFAQTTQKSASDGTCLAIFLLQKDSFFSSTATSLAVI